MDFKQILLFLCFGIIFSAHTAQQQEIKQREEKACAQQSQPVPSKVKICGTQEFLDTEKIESFTDKTFETLIKEQWSQCDPYVLARVTVRNKNGKESVQYYDAHAFIQDRFGAYPLNNRELETTTSILHYQRDGEPEEYLVDKFNPHNKQIEQISARYFVYDPHYQGHGFKLMFTEEDLFGEHSFPRTWLEANQNFDKYRTLKAKAQVHLGVSSLKGQEQDTKKYARALNYFERAANQIYNQLARAQAQELLGQMYYYGWGVPRDYEQARKYFELAIAQTQNQQTFLDLGVIYFKGLGIEKNHDKALSYFQQATWSQEDPGARAQAQVYLGKIYLHEKRDYAEARNYLTIAARNKFNQAAKAEAQKLLKELATIIPK